MSYERLGDVAVAQGQLKKAAQAYQDGLEHSKEAGGGGPQQHRVAARPSVSYNKLGDVAVAQGQLKEAAQAYQDGLEIMKKLVVADPSNTQWQR